MTCQICKCPASTTTKATDNSGNSRHYIYLATAYPRLATSTQGLQYCTPLIKLFQTIAVLCQQYVFRLDYCRFKLAEPSAGICDSLRCVAGLDGDAGDGRRCQACGREGTAAVGQALCQNGRLHIVDGGLLVVVPRLVLPSHAQSQNLQV